jgi:hypothetical protein
MAGGIRILRAIPGSTSLVPIIRDFCKREGVVTAFSESLLVACRQHVPDDAPVEVTAFGKVVRDLLALCGEVTPLIASSGQSLTAISEACRTLADDSPFRAASAFAGTHRALERTLEELRDWGIDRHEMRQMAAEASPRLQAKLTSLAHIDEESGRLLAQLGRAPSDSLLRASLDSIPEADGALSRLLLFAQGEIPPLKVQWLRWAVSHGVEITVVLDRHAAESELFAGADQAIEALQAPIEEHGTGNRLLNNLFSPQENGGAPVAVSIVSAPDPLAEAEWALRGCLDLETPTSAALYARNLESYAPLIEAAATRLRIPVRVHRRAPLLTNSFAKLTFAALDFAVAKDVRALRPILQSSYLGLNAARREEILAAIREAYRMRALQWVTLEDWAQAHADGAPWLSYLLDWRKRAKAGPYNWREWLPVLGDILRADERLPWSTLAMEGDLRMRERDVRARNKIEQLIGDFVSIQASQFERFVPLGELVGVCRGLIEQADVTIPTTEHGILVSDRAEVVAGSDTLFVLGMLEGDFPRRRSEDPVLTDAERAEISALRNGKPRLRDSHQRSHEERDEFYRVCAAASNRLVFSYPASGDDRDNIPAFYLEEIRRCVSTTEITYSRSQLAPDVGVTEADTRLRQALDAPRQMPAEVELVTEEARQSLIPDADAEYTPSELRDALQCPFQYMSRHRLKLRPKRHQARWNSLRKLPQAAFLLQSPDAAHAELALGRALETALDDLMADLPEWELQLLRSGGKRLIAEWVQREMKARTKWPKEAGSIQTSVRFGDGLNQRLGKGLTTLSGSVPAVSRIQGYRVGHLYASRAPEGRELSASDKLYLGLHFLALNEKGSTPALEIETMAGERQFMMLYRRPDSNLSAEVPYIRTLDLAAVDDAVEWQRAFYREVTALVEDAMSKIRSGSIQPIPEEHCTWCDYGELCRRSPFFGEESSPFGPDRVTDDE